ncbi:MAG: YsnF/AvaK domain-containing protein [Actinobacteria bacterium]|nr:YsnF/AvaK domain-containing protein [Actinomycetota bacterium]
MRDTDDGARSDAEDASVVRHEEELELGAMPHEAGAVRARKHVETFDAEQTVERETEHVDEIAREPGREGDSGEIETLPDGSVSIPILEEELVVSKRLVVRERVIVRKRTVTEHERVQAELRRERVEIDVEGDVEVEER